MSKPSIIRVSGKSPVKSVAGRITKTFEHNNEVEIEAVGASAINQGIKAIAMARGFLAIKGYDLVCRPGFYTITIGQEEKTAIRLVLKLQ